MPIIPSSYILLSSQTVVLLVASIPLAIEIVTNTTLAIGSKALSHHGILVTRLSAIEDMAGMSILCSDKTGTLTLNKMVLQDETPVFKEGQTQETVLVNAALAAKWKGPARDALDRLTLGSVNMALLEDYEQLGKSTIVAPILSLFFLFPFYSFITAWSLQISFHSTQPSSVLRVPFVTPKPVKSSRLLREHPTSF
jgi:magnesium-transporting ATPase (P-type)